MARAALGDRPARTDAGTLDFDHACTEVGQLAPGFSGDVVVVEGDPLADLAALQRDRIRLVVAAGRVVPMPEKAVDRATVTLP